MKECFVLGAGFTRGFCEQAPLMLDFLKKAEEYGYFIPNKAHAKLSEIIKRYFKSHNQLSIEDLATFLTRQTSSYWKKENCGEAFEQLVEVIVSYLAANVNSPFRIDNSRNKQNFLKFAHYIAKNGIDVISFNYDTVLDELLFQTKKWWVIDGYGEVLPYPIPVNPGRIEIDVMGHTSIIERTIVRNKYGMVNDQTQAPYFQPSAMKLLKLHGSINWTRKEMPEIDGRHLTFVQMPAFGNLMAQPINHESITGLPMKHVIIPPLLIKTSYYDDLLVKKIWQLARLSLTAAKKVHIIGYSFPEGDFPTRHLFVEAFAKPPPVLSLNSDNKKPEIIFVNPSEINGKKIETFFKDFIDCEFQFVKEKSEDYIQRFIES